MSGSAQRIYALVLRHIHLWRSSVMRLVDSIYWPAVQMVMWGFMTQYLMPQASLVAQAAGVLLSGLLRLASTRPVARLISALASAMFLLLILIFKCFQRYRAYVVNIAHISHFAALGFTGFQFHRH